MKSQILVSLFSKRSMLKAGLIAAVAVAGSVLSIHREAPVPFQPAGAGSELKLDLFTPAEANSCYAAVTSSTRAHLVIITCCYSGSMGQSISCTETCWGACG